MSARDWCNIILSFIGDVIPELIGAAIGVYGGYRYGLRQERRLREEEEKERKEDMIKSLITEVSSTKSSLGKGLKEKRFSDNFNVTYFESLLLTDAFDSTVFSGNYRLLAVETQLCTTWLFNGCKRMNMLTDRLEFGDISENEARYVSSEISRLHSGLTDYTDVTILRLQKELGYPWTIKVRE